ncbi:hypothetical protein HYU12_03260 [Candidatus Woesearchaeota archaeon]|nr:hypothetical protein [Candidatus Woesearchaeota archaeon]
MVHAESLKSFGFLHTGMAVFIRLGSSGIVSLLLFLLLAAALLFFLPMLIVLALLIGAVAFIAVMIRQVFRKKAKLERGKGVK